MNILKKCLGVIVADSTIEECLGAKKIFRFSILTLWPQDWINLLGLNVAGGVSMNTSFYYSPLPKTFLWSIWCEDYSRFANILKIASPRSLIDEILYSYKDCSRSLSTEI